MLWFDANDMIGTQRSNLQFSLLDQDLRVTPTGGNTFSFTAMIKYHVYIGSGTIPSGLSMMLIGVVLFFVSALSVRLLYMAGKNENMYRPHEIYNKKKREVTCQKHC